MTLVSESEEEHPKKLYEHQILDQLQDNPILRTNQSNSFQELLPGMAEM